MKKTHMQKSIRRKLRLCTAILLAATLLLAGCTNDTPNSGSQPPQPGGSTERAAVSSSELQFASPQKGDTLAVIETDLGSITALLFPQLAPLAVENFRVLTEESYYTGTLFGRVKEGFVIQGGEKADGNEGGSIWGRPFATERSDLLRHYAGALCMAPNGEPDTHETQFYIVSAYPDQMTEDSLAVLRTAKLRDGVVDTYAQAGGLPYLDNTDTVFGQVVEGMDVVDKIASLATGEDQRPKKEVRILGVTLTTYGEDSSGEDSVAA